MRSVVLPFQPNSGNLLVYQTGVLPCTDVSAMVDPARKDVVVERAFPAFEPGENAGAGGFKKFELNRPPGFLLNDDRSRTHWAPADKFTDLDFYDVASAKFAVDR